MFNGAKPTFGAPQPAQPAFGFGATAGTPVAFGGATSAFGKPATQGFGAAPAFGQAATSAFGQPAGQQQQQPQAAGTSLFGASAAQTSAFGAPANQTAGGFGGFGQPQQQQQQTSLFGAAQPQVAQQNTSLFGQASTSAFGAAATAAKPAAFGFGAAQPQAAPSLFGQPSTSAAAGGFGGFGAAATAQQQQQQSAFGAAGQQQSAFGAVASVATGSAVAKYQETLGTDTLMKNGQSNNVSTKQHCITAMKEYEAKSFEELRMEDYMANRKGPQPGGVGQPQQALGGGGMFGAGAAGGSLFGQSNTTMGGNTSIFGQTAGQQQQQQQQPALQGFGAAAGGSAFGQAFGQAAAQLPAQTGGLFGGAAQPAAGGLFGAKTFATPTVGGGLFGQPAASAAAPAFGQPAAAAPAFGAFGQQQQQPAAAAPLFGQQAAATGGGLFGQTSQAPGGFGGFGAAAPATSTAGTGGLFGQKPAQTGFGAIGTGGFGQPAAAAPASAFGSFGQPAAGAAQPGSLFASSFNKPAASAPSFGFGTAQAAPTVAGTNTGGLGLFGGGAAAKPGGLFGTAPAPAAGGLFGGGAFGTGTLGGGGAGTLGGGLGLGQSAGLGLGQSGGFGSLGTGANSLGMGGMGGGGQQFHGGIGAGSAVPIHQQILSMATSPYGDNPIFKDLRPSAGLSEDALKPTNPLAQKAMLESSAGQFKVSPRVGGGLTPGGGGSHNASGGMRLKPVGSSFSKKSLFGGLEEFDSSVEESFSLKPNAKRLILKPKVATPTAAVQPLQQQHQQSGTQSPAHLRRSAVPQRAAEDADGSFRNQIPLQAPAPSAADAQAGGGRRESWLHSNALEKHTKQMQMGGGAGAGGGGAGGLDNTIQELVSGGDDAAGGRPGGGGRLPVLLERRAPNSDGQSDESALNKSAAAGRSEAGQLDESSRLSVSRSFLDESTAGGQDAAALAAAAAPHPCGITLLRAGYYTIPALDTLEDYLAEDGSCRVPNLTIGRRGYGSVYFDAEIDVAGLNLDELVHFRHKEVIIYPDDENKPPVGSDLNRKAEVTLDQVWPQDKTQREPIKDRDRLEAMDYQGKLRRVCDKHDMRFVDYRPETGSWVFRVEHFSKYGLNDSDDEDEDVGAMPVDAKKARLMAEAAAAAGGKVAVKPQLNAKAPQSAAPARHGLAGNDQLSMETQQRFNNGETFVADGGAAASFQPLSPSSAVAMDCGTDAHKLQLMKASFFVDDDFDGKSVVSDMLDGRDSPDQTVPHPVYLRQRLHPAASSVAGAASSSLASNSSTIGDRDHHQPRHLLSNLPQSVVRRNAASSHGPAPATTVTTISKPLGPRSAPLRPRPQIAIVRIPRAVTPLLQSLLAPLANQRCAVDAAFAMGRQFRCGWAAPAALLTLNTMAGCQRLPTVETALDEPRLLQDLFAGRRTTDRTRSVLVLSRLRSGAPIAGFAASIEPHLQLQLRRSERRQSSANSSAGSGCCPHFAPLVAAVAPGIEDGNESASSSASDAASVQPTLFAEHLQVAQATARLSGSAADATHCTVWSLCDALWGYQEELDGEPADSHLAVQRRRELLSQWLESVVADDQQSRESRSSYLQHMLDLLHTHRVREAAELCCTNGDINLAFLLAQLSGGPAVRQLVQHQIAAWQEAQADAFIAPERLKAYMLAAGVSLISSAHGAINAFEQLDWLRAFALNVWYLSAATASITDSLLAYERSYRGEEFQAEPPTPAYGERVAAGGVEDVRFHLLKLYSQRSHPLEALLNPATHTADAMDMRLSWLLMQTLEAIGYRHCSRWSAEQLHTGFAAQLERNGLWHWAVFVLLHLPDARGRELAVQQLLYRWVRLGERDAREAQQVGASGGEEEAEEEGAELAGYDEQERFVVDELGVPVRWVYWAKAVRAGALRRWSVQAEYLLRAEQWSAAHEVIMLQLVPDAVINDNIAYVQRLLLRFPADGQRVVPNWPNQAGLLLEYIRLSERFERLRSMPETHIDTAWLQLQQPLSELCSRINLFPCPTAKHRLCQSEIAQCLANLVSGLRLAGTPGTADISTCALMRVILEKLPLPQEYAKQKLRALLEDTRLLEELQVR